MSVLNNSLLLGQEGGAGYVVERSLRFSSIDSAYLSRSVGTPSSTTTATFSFWVKRSSIPNSGTSGQTIFGGHSSRNCTIEFDDAGFDKRHTFRIVDETSSSGSYVAQVATDQVFRDPSAWYHIVLALDSTQATSTNRIKMYVNGVQVSSFVGAQIYPSQNASFSCLVSSTKSIGSRIAYSDQYFNGYLAEFYFIDGSALAASDFGQTDATTGQWVPKAFSGSYGSQGWKLNFSDNSAATATTLGKDYSGNSNNWTPNNLSVTAGAGNDSLVDTPTSYGTDTGAGGEVRGNYATLNPLKTGDTTSFAQGNLFWRTTSNGPDRCVLATIGMSSGKWYWECYMDEGTATAVGIALDSVSLTTGGAGSNSYVYYSIGTYYNSGSSTGSPSSFTTGDLIGVAFDADTGKLWFAKNGTWQSSGDPGAGTNPAMTLTTGLTYFPLVGDSGGASQSQVTANFGQRAFAYTNNRSGFKALCDTNLPAPVVAKPSEVMDVVTWSGDNVNPRSITTGFGPDLVWIKPRNQAYYNTLYDSVRTATARALSSNTTDQENGPTNNWDTSNGYLSSFDSTGFTLTGGSTANYWTNRNGVTYVAWCWDAGSSTVTNTQGSITSQVRANASAGFSIATFSTNSSSGNATIGHGLNVAPKFIIVKSRNATYNWDIYHGGISNAKDGRLIFTTAAFTTAQVPFGGVDPTSTVFTLSQTFYGTGIDCVAYCFAPVAGYSSMGSYVGNGSTDGVFVFTGHQSRWLMVKRTDTTSQWSIWDTARNTYNASGTNLWADSSEAEATSSNYDVDFLSNGFKMRNTHAARNASGGTYIYISFAQNPFQYARAR